MALSLVLSLRLHRARTDDEEALYRRGSRRHTSSTRTDRRVVVIDVGDDATRQRAARQSQADAAQLPEARRRLDAAQGTLRRA